MDRTAPITKDPIKGTVTIVTKGGAIVWINFKDIKDVVCS